MAFKVDAAYVRDTVLAPLIGRGARYEGALGVSVIEEFVAEAKLATEQRLSTRFTPTNFSGWDGVGSRPGPTNADPTAIPPVLPAEIEPAYMWPNMVPGLGFPTFRMRVRPVLELYGGILRLPGAPAPGVNLKPEWFRVESYTAEVNLMPNFGGASLIMPNLPFGLFNWMRQRIPDGVIFQYRTGEGGCAERHGDAEDLGRDSSVSRCRLRAVINFDEARVAQSGQCVSLGVDRGVCNLRIEGHDLLLRN